MEFKDRLGALRRARHISQEDLADTVEVSKDSLRRWENGKQHPRLDELIRLASALNMTVGALIGEEPVPSLPKDEPSPAPFAPRVAKKRSDPGKIVIQVGSQTGSLKVEVPATPEGYAFVGEKLGDFKIEEVPQQEFIKDLQMDVAEEMG